MSIESDCCETSDRVPRQAACPVTGTTGPQVPLQTVKAILTAQSLRRLVPTTYYFCPEPACAVVYSPNRVSAIRRATSIGRSGKRNLRAAGCCAIASGKAKRRSQQRLPPPVDRTPWTVSKDTSAQAGARATLGIPRGICCLADLRAAIVRLGAE